MMPGRTLSRWSIRTRLTLWYSLVLLAGLALFGAGVWTVVSRAMLGSLDDDLRQQANGVAMVLRSESDPAEPQKMTEELAEYVRATPGGNLVEVRDAQGRRILASAALNVDWKPSTQPAFDVRQTPSGRYRTLATATEVSGQPYYIRVATPLDATEATLRRVKELLLWTSPMLLLLASLCGYWISGRALAPVDAMTQAARSIGIGNLSQRLDVPAAGDELQRLSTTWNDMLARLESAVKRLSQFTADASHELRTPIALIRTTAELTLRRERAPETYREALRQVMAETEKTAVLVDNLLLLARADAGLPLELERIELTPLVRDVCRQGEVLAGARQLHLAAEMPDQPVYVEANDPELRRLLLLLVDNAVKYTPAGGRITVSLACGQDGATVAVQDTGIGIPGAALPHVFERFYRVDESRNRDQGGAGLGLSIAKWIADRHHAHLEAESVPGEGSTFRVRFPLS
jgi:two-component system, OmpR family, heavy metal sensor histidine kinase CusS